ncbi:MAG: peptide deformylase [Pseudonocardia sp.]
MSGVVGDDVVTIGDPRLKAETQAIDDVQAVADLLARMVDRLRELNGTGLAAPQIGASVKVAWTQLVRAPPGMIMMESDPWSDVRGKWE